MPIRQSDPAVGRADAIARPGYKRTITTGAGCLLLCLFAVQTGCMGPVMHQRAVGFVDPPRDKLQASLATDRIKVCDVLQFRLTDGSTVTLNGTYKVGADGAIELSGHGKVQVAGKTMEEAKQAVREAMAVKSLVHAAFDLDRSEYYLVTVTTDGVQDLTRVPLGGKETVKDAVNGIPRLSSKVLWLVRPTPGQTAKEQVLPIDWEGISRLDDNNTNYPLMAGDWLFVADEPATGFGRFFGAVTSMLSPRKGDSLDAPRPPSKPSPQRFSVDKLDNPSGERI